MGTRRLGKSIRDGDGLAPRMFTSRFAPTSAAIATSPRWPVSITSRIATCRPWSARWRWSSGHPHEVDTIFVGGGTPTRLDAAELERLTGIIRRWLVRPPGAEWTVEANPGTLDVEKAEILAAAGVDRVSLGAQSFRTESLRVLERHHGRPEVEQAVAIVGPRFPRWSLDLIFGVPGSGLDDWRSDLEIALGFGPEHLSCYGLVYEKGTALWKQQQSGEVRPVEEEVERSMYEATIQQLAGAGLAMYEISNFAAPRP